jgi:hypothetical protein
MQGGKAIYRHPIAFRIRLAVLIENAFGAEVLNQQKALVEILAEDVGCGKPPGAQPSGNGDERHDVFGQMGDL